MSNVVVGAICTTTSGMDNEAPSVRGTHRGDVQQWLREGKHVQIGVRLLVHERLHTQLEHIFHKPV